MIWDTMTIANEVTLMQQLRAKHYVTTTLQLLAKTVYFASTTCRTGLGTCELILVNTIPKPNTKLITKQWLNIGPLVGRSM